MAAPWQLPVRLLPFPGNSVLDAYNTLVALLNGQLAPLNPSNVTITGGTIDGTVIGSTVPAAGTFTTLNATTGFIGGDGIVTLTASQSVSNKAFTASSWTGGTIAGAIINNSTVGLTTPAAAQFTTATATTFVGALTGNATTATKLQTARTISITGDLTYTSPGFDGSGNITAAGTLATVNANVGTFGSGSLVPVITVNAKGLITSVTTSATTAGNLTGAITSVGLATSLGSFTSGQLAGALTDETGSGPAVFANNATMSNVTFTATSTPVTVNSTNPADEKIVFQANGVRQGGVGSNATIIAGFIDSGGTMRMGCSNADDFIPSVDVALDLGNTSGPFAWRNLWIKSVNLRGATSGTTSLLAGAIAAGSVTLPVVSCTLYGTGSGTITSAQLQNSMTDNQGSGRLVFDTSPTITSASLASPTMTGIPVAPTAASGTNTAQVATTAFVAASVALPKAFLSSATAITAAATTTFTHGLGVVPRVIVIILTCTTANVGYSVGDIVCWTFGQFEATGGAGLGVSCTLTSTSILALVASGGIALLNKSTGVPALITNADWTYQVQAFA